MDYLGLLSMQETLSLRVLNVVYVKASFIILTNQSQINVLLGFYISRVAYLTIL